VVADGVRGSLIPPGFALQASEGNEREKGDSDMLRSVAVEVLRALQTTLEHEERVCFFCFFVFFQSSVRMSCSNVLLFEWLAAHEVPATIRAACVHQVVAASLDLILPGHSECL
jgi:hypothetical protein